MYKILMFKLLMLPFFSIAQTSSDKMKFRRLLKDLNLSYKIPPNFTVLDTPKIYVVADTSFGFRFTKTKKIDILGDRLRCSKGIFPGEIFYRVADKEMNIIISYSLFKYPDMSKYQGNYDTQLAFYLKAFKGATDSTCRTIFKQSFVQQKYKANDGGIYCNLCENAWNGLNNYKVVYLAKRPNKGVNLKNDSGSFIQIIYQYNNSMSDKVNHLIERNYKYIRYKD